MSLANVAYSASLTWADGTTTLLEEQMRVPMANRHPVEMGQTGHEREIEARLRAEPLYADLFPKAFPGDRDPITLDNVRKAIACFERTIFSGNSAYDRLVWKDDQKALSESAKRGMALFFSERTRCSRCHGGFTFSGPVVWAGGPNDPPAFQNNGLPEDAAAPDAGLFKVTRRPGDRGRFRAPTLRNVAVTAPYMHDGRFATLEAVIDHYAKGGSPAPDRSPLVKGFALTGEERRDLVAFLESLTDQEFLEDPRFADPWRR